MKVVPPVEITPAKMISSNVPENDAPEWAAGTHKQGSRVIIKDLHTVYEVLAETTTDSPLDGIAKAVPSWMVIGPTNRWKMLNKRVGNTWAIGTFTSNPESIDLTIRPAVRINSIGIVGVRASTIQIKMTVGGEVVYDKTFAMSIKGGGSWYRYYFGAFTTKDNVAQFDLPPFNNADIQIIASAPGNTARIGMLVVGMSKDIGWARFGSGVGIESYSSIKEDAFGAVTITPRGKRRVVEFDIAMYANQVSTALRVLEPLSDSAALYIGSEAVDWSITVGRFDRLALINPNVALAEYSLEVRSLM